MRGLMMNYLLTIPALLRRYSALYPGREIVSLGPDGTAIRSTAAACVERALRLGRGLRQSGLAPGAKVATLCWNHAPHLEAYFGVPSAGLVLHPLNPRLPSEDIEYIMQDAGDEVVIVDADLEPLLGRWPGRRIINGEGRASAPESYESLLASARPDDPCPDPPESHAAILAYTSGTTGRPKGVAISHRAIVLHSLGTALPDGFNLGERDTVLAAVPMFHANAWGLPFTAAMVGARQVLVRNAFDPVTLLRMIEAERVTVAAGVPTIWLGVLRELEQNPGQYDIASLNTVIVGGGACPPALIRAFEEQYDVAVVTSWGMTELSPVGTVGRPEVTRPVAERCRPGRPLPLVELRIRQDGRLMPWDGQSMGELEVRGPWIAMEYHGGADPSAFTADGWFRTGDIATIDRSGVLEIRDRAKDVIKSGGEWISSVALEQALLAHPGVADAAVIAVPHPQWQERPLAIMVLREGAETTGADLKASLEKRFPSWYLPDDFVFVPMLPRTATGKVQKALLRLQYGGQR